MNRRGFFGALVGGLAAAAGARVPSRSLGQAGRLRSIFGPDLQVLAPEATLDPREFAHWCRQPWSGASIAPQLAQGEAGDLHELQKAPPQDRVFGGLGGVHDVELVLGGVDDLGRDAGSIQHHADHHLNGQDLAAEEGALFDRITRHPPLDLSPPTAPDIDAAVWLGHSGTITATASLPPLAQVECLVELFSRSGDAAPSFAAALIGELVLTRVRLAAADPRLLYGLAPVAA